LKKKRKIIFSSLMGRRLHSRPAHEAGPAQLRACLCSRLRARSRPTSGRSSPPCGRMSPALLTWCHAVAPIAAPRLQIGTAEQPLPILAILPLPLPALALASNRSCRGRHCCQPRELYRQHLGSARHLPPTPLPLCSRVLVVGKTGKGREPLPFFSPHGPPWPSSPDLVPAPATALLPPSPRTVARFHCFAPPRNRCAPSRALPWLGMAASLSAAPPLRHRRR
jgi:hypothetical protein